MGVGYASCQKGKKMEQREFNKSKFVTLFGGELVMIKLKMSIEDISDTVKLLLKSSNFFPSTV